LIACQRAEPAGAPLPKVQLADPRYDGLVFLVATVRRAGPDFVVTNDSTQPWFHITVVLEAGAADEYRLQLSEVDPGQTITVRPAQFGTTAGVTFDAQRVTPHTLIVSAEIGEGGPTGVYAVRL
jgi:vancomycin resistance protein YoaR